MKKNIVFGLAFMMIALNLSAQDAATVNAKISRHFNESFPQAQKVTWASLPKKIAQAQFVNNGQSSIAYFDQNGNVITSGRRIRSIDLLPLKIQNGLLLQKDLLQKKFGELAILHVYEMITADATKYFSILQNTMVRVVVSVNTAGFPTVMSKRMLNTNPPAESKDVIAKKN